MARHCFLKKNSMIGFISPRIKKHTKAVHKTCEFQLHYTSGDCTDSSWKNGKLKNIEPHYKKIPVRKHSPKLYHNH